MDAGTERLEFDWLDQKGNRIIVKPLKLFIGLSSMSGTTTWLFPEIVIAILIIEYWLVNHFTPDPVEDERIHVHQAQHYWAYDFSYWDRRITTPPGLYLASILLKLLSICGLKPNVKTLRFASLLFSIGIIFVEPVIGPIILLSPIANQYCLLFYTDIASLFLVLLAGNAVSTGRNHLAAFIDLTSLLFRQTNIVWAGWHYFQIAQMLIHENGLTIKMIVYPTVAYGAVAALFSAFVILNKGIVLGDRSSHKPGFYPIHFNACMIFMAVLFLPCLSRMLPSLFTMIPVLLIDFHIHRKGFPAHPYHLDPASRHITSRIVRALHHSRIKTMALVPLASVSKIAVYQTICANKNNSNIEALAFLFCAVAVTMPCSLLEPRYFIIPAVMFAKLIIWDRTAFLHVMAYYLMADALLLEQLVGPWRGSRPTIW